jgi:hypothetical protein
VCKVKVNFVFVLLCCTTHILTYKNIIRWYSIWRVHWFLSKYMYNFFTIGIDISKKHSTLLATYWFLFQVGSCDVDFHSTGPCLGLTWYLPTGLEMFDIINKNGAWAFRRKSTLIETRSWPKLKFVYVLSHIFNWIRSGYLMLAATLQRTTEHWTLSFVRIFIIL